VEQELAAGLGEGQIAEFVEDDEVHAGQMFGEPTQMFGEPTLPAVASLGLEPVDEIHHVVKPATDPERMQLLAMAMAGGSYRCRSRRPARRYAAAGQSHHWRDHARASR
jgi:hypothetical protein